jgi:hypothetical protein
MEQGQDQLLSAPHNSLLESVLRTVPASAAPAANIGACLVLAHVSQGKYGQQYQLGLNLLGKPRHAAHVPK